MARFDEVARERTDLSESDLEHLRALVADWTLLADLAFADLVLWLPTWHGGGFVAADQVRPATGPTLLVDDVVGQYAARGRRPLLDRALATRTVTPARVADPAAVPATEEAIPVIQSGRVVAVVARHCAVSLRATGRLESAYLEAADDLVDMVVEGTFPPASPLGRTGTPPRVGDGLIRIDERGQVTFASPNARSAYHRLGLASELVGSDLARVTARLARRPGPIDEGLAAVTTGRVAGGAEVANDRAVVTLRGVPLRSRTGAVGALVLVRDVTEIRRRDRELIDQGRDDPGDPPPGEEQPADRRRAAAPAGAAARRRRRRGRPWRRRCAGSARSPWCTRRCRTCPTSASSSTRSLDRLWSMVARRWAPGRTGAAVERVGAIGELPSES